MKAFYLSVIFLTQLVFTSSAQQVLPTTIDEYNYLVKGYQIQMESGLDMKKGYQFNDMFNKQMGSYHFTLKALIREKKNEVAALFVIAKSQVSSKTYYLCIPHGNIELVERYWSELNNWDRPMSSAFAQIMSTVLCSFFTVGHEMEKKINSK